MRCRMANGKRLCGNCHVAGAPASAAPFAGLACGRLVPDGRRDTPMTWGTDIIDRESATPLSEKGSASRRAERPGQRHLVPARPRGRADGEMAHHGEDGAGGATG